MKSLNHSVIDINYHVCFATKYRKKMNWNETQLKEAFAAAAAIAKIELLSIGIAPDHVHLLLSADHSDICISKIIGTIKMQTSLKLNKTENWQGWQRGYYCASVGSSKKSKEMVLQYLQNQ